jgi:hypothetical protein
MISQKQHWKKMGLRRLWITIEVAMKAIEVDAFSSFLFSVPEPKQTHFFS